MMEDDMNDRLKRAQGFFTEWVVQDFNLVI